MILILLSSLASINWLNLVASIGSILVSLALIYFSFRNTRKTVEVTIKNTEMSVSASKDNTLMTLNSKRIEEKKNEIYKKLNEFYGPFFQLRAKSQLLYNEFSEKFKSTSTDGQFRTLTYLLDGGEVLGNEKVLLDEIIRIGEKCEKLIHEKAGLIDDDELRKIWFPKASTHYLILRLAYNKSLTGDSTKFQKHTFPNEIDGLVASRIEILQSELKELEISKS
jgi:hypothetical protein